MLKSAKAFVAQLFQADDEPETLSRLFLSLPRELQDNVLNFCITGEIAALGRHVQASEETATVYAISPDLEGIQCYLCSCPVQARQY